MMRWKLGAMCLVLAACSAEQPRQQPTEDKSSNDAVAAPVNDVATNGAAATPSGNVSQFTKDGLNKCHVVEQDEEHGPYYRHRCPGVGGYNYEVVEHDLRQDLVIIHPNGRRDEIGMSGAAGEGGFNILGPTFEWRGPAGMPPQTMTVRFNVQEDPEPNKPDRSYLVVIRLTPPSCIVAAVPPGAGQNEKARAIADRRPLQCKTY